MIYRFEINNPVILKITEINNQLINYEIYNQETDKNKNITYKLLMYNNKDIIKGQILKSIFINNFIKTMDCPQEQIKK